jgi:hypothetical protein
MATAFLWDERCFWHGGGSYALTMPVGGLVQPMPNGLPENPETKRRLKNLVEVTGLMAHLHAGSADPASWADLAPRPPRNLPRPRSRPCRMRVAANWAPARPSAAGGFEIAALSAGLAKRRCSTGARGARCQCLCPVAPAGPPLPARPAQRLLPLANIAIAIRAAQAETPLPPLRRHRLGRASRQRDRGDLPRPIPKS